MMIARPALLKRVRDGLKANPVVALLGPRQCSKTTLARGLAETVTTSYFDLENPADLARLAEPMLALERLKGLVVIDEVQRRPDLFPVLRVLADRRAAPARFLVLGSASPELLRQTSETLAGRVRFVEMGGFSLDEAGLPRWLRRSSFALFNPGTKTSASAKSGRRRYTCATPASCTRCSACPTSTRSKATRNSAHRGSRSRSSSCYSMPAPARLTTGARRPGPSWICCFSSAASASGSR